MHMLPVPVPPIATFVGMVGAILSVLGFLRPGQIPRPRRKLTTESIMTTGWARARYPGRGRTRRQAKRPGRAGREPGHDPDQPKSVLQSYGAIPCGLTALCG
jgi:hypothetical protein